MWPCGTTLWDSDTTRKPPESDPVLPNQPLFGPENASQGGLEGRSQAKEVGQEVSRARRAASNRVVDAHCAASCATCRVPACSLSRASVRPVRHCPGWVCHDAKFCRGICDAGRHPLIPLDTPELYLSESYARLLTSECSVTSLWQAR